MNQLHQDRRARGGTDRALSTHPDVVRRALRIQAAVGTIGALEFLSAQGVSHEVSRRVLAGTDIRMDDSVTPA